MIYLIFNGTYYKIGVTKGDVYKRLAQLQTGSAEKLTLISVFSSRFPYKVEKSLHRWYGSERKQGEWFYLSETQVETFVETCETIERGLLVLKESGNHFVSSF